MATMSMQDVLENEPLSSVKLRGNRMETLAQVDGFFNDAIAVEVDGARRRTANKETYLRVTGRVIGVIWPMQTQARHQSARSAGVGFMSDELRLFRADEGGGDAHIKGDIDINLPLLIDVYRVCLGRRLSLNGNVLDPDTLISRGIYVGDFVQRSCGIAARRHGGNLAALPFFKVLHYDLPAVCVTFTPLGNLLLFDMNRAQDKANFEHIREDIAGIYQDYRDAGFEDAYRVLDLALANATFDRGVSFDHVNRDVGRYYDELHDANDAAIASYRRRMHEKYLE